VTDIEQLRANERFWKTSFHNPVMRAFISRWQHGDFVSFEGMLIHLALALAEQNERLTSDLTNRMMRDPGPRIVQSPTLHSSKEGATDGMADNPRDSGHADAERPVQAPDR
jgi:hypothetical protein